MDWILCHLSRMELTDDELFATPSDVGGEEKELIFYAGSGLQTCPNV